VDLAGELTCRNEELRAAPHGVGDPDEDIAVRARPEKPPHGVLDLGGREFPLQLLPLGDLPLQAALPGTYFVAQTFGSGLWQREIRQVGTWPTELVGDTSG